MTHEELRDVAKRQPFKPFRLHLTTGATFDVRHPDLIMVGRRSAVIGIADEPSDTIYERTFQVDLLHVVGVEDLPARSSRRNGKK
ncbi:MAG TPA: hypothetical protein VJ783_21070 [Pirellulales bacterium]|nr:hypothetical protein [Pirellulales bacterium]